jgi:cytoskeleton protein RodZ
MKMLRSNTGMTSTEMTLETAPAHDVPISDILKRKRLDRGFDLLDVARETRVPLRHLNAIEAGNFSSLPALAYSIGFVRTYARYLGLDPDAAARQYKAETTQVESSLMAAPVEIDAESRLPGRKVIFGSVAALASIVAIIVAYSALKGDDAETAASPPLAETTAQPAAQTAPVLSTTAAPPVTETLTPPAPAADPTLATPAAVPAPLPSPNGPVLAGVPTTGMVLRAKEDSWIKVTDGGPVSLKIGILKAGETYSVPQVPNLRLQTGNAGGLELIYNGRLLPPLGAKGEVLRNKLLDPAQAVTGN